MRSWTGGKKRDRRVLIEKVLADGDDEVALNVGVTTCAKTDSVESAWSKRVRRKKLEERRDGYHRQTECRS